MNNREKKKKDMVSFKEVIEKEENQGFAYNMMASDESDLYTLRKKMERLEKDKNEHPEKYWDVENMKDWYERRKKMWLAD